MKYEVWVSVGSKEFQLPCKTLEEAHLFVDLIKELRDPESDYEWAINDLEDGSTIQVG